MKATPNGDSVLMVYLRYCIQPNAIVVKSLLMVTVNGVNQQRESALLILAKHALSTVDCFRVLINQGADCTHCDSHQRDCLMLYAEYSKLQDVNVYKLLAQLCDINRVNW